MRGALEGFPLLRADYLAVVNAKTLEPLTEARGSVALLGAVHVGATRLIDNLLVDVS
jgi:pantoate--beta-alanine ligase